MVSKARLDLPDPDSPVTTTSLSRGISTLTFLRLCTRAPCTAMVVRTPLVRASLVLILGVSHIDEGLLFDQNVTTPGQLYRRRDLREQSLIGQVLAREAHSLNI